MVLIILGIADFVNRIGNEAICRCFRMNLADNSQNLDCFPRDVGIEVEVLPEDEDKEGLERAAGLDDDAVAYDMVGEDEK